MDPCTTSEVTEVEGGWIIEVFVLQESLQKSSSSCPLLKYINVVPAMEPVSVLPHIQYNE